MFKSENGMPMLEKQKNYMLSHVLYALHNIFLGAKPLHDVYHDKSHFIEVDTWLGGFDMTLGSLWVFIMIL